ncbi:MAG: hypothetical protein NXH88_09210 [Hyphomonas sp.]|nr:hypothetical protein [Hyphomonas sp.]
MSEEKKVLRKWGYHPTEEARIFELAEGEDLPEGWAPRPIPTEEVSEPVSDESEGSDESEDGDEGSDDLAAENESLKAQVEDLTAQLEAANQRIAELEGAGNEETKEEAETTDPDLKIPHPGAPKPDLVEIPEDWAQTGAGTHFRRIKIAKLIDPEAEVSSDDAAIAIIEAELAKRG